MAERGRAHRLESQNAYIACKTDKHDESAITICDDCGVVSEHIDTGVLDALSTVIANSGFAPSRHVIELQGVQIVALNKT